jgi:hypothetical protein
MCTSTFSRHQAAVRHWGANCHLSKFQPAQSNSAQSNSASSAQSNSASSEPHNNENDDNENDESVQSEESEQSQQWDPLNDNSDNVNSENELPTCLQGVDKSHLKFIQAFQHQTLMCYFHGSEFTERHSGLRYLVTRAFVGCELLSFENLAHTPESRWHFYNFVQFMSMTEKQRKRQGKVINRENINPCLFVRTSVPSYSEMNQIYGRSNQHSMWRCLPIPTVQNIEGIAYINPLHAIIYLLSNNVELDDYMVHAGDNDDDEDEDDTDKTINYVTESIKARLWRQEIKAKFKDITAILLWVVDWRDGFGANRTKQNRKSTVAWTISVSTPRNRINAIDNTRAIALGLKKNGNWSSVEHKFQKDMSRFGNGLNPVEIYHGGLKKCTTLQPCPVQAHIIGYMAR